MSIDEIYNKHIAEEKLKNGSKYERLAAVVFKSLDESDTVIHDLRLRGDGKKAQHQIDVTIEKNHNKKRILIECKEYDSLIGIGIIRDFFGAVNQIKPDEAIVITKKGYTSGARKFADDENIKLAILKEAEESDWDGLIRTIVVNGTLIIPYDLAVALHIDLENASNSLKQQYLQYGNETLNNSIERDHFYNSTGEQVANFSETINTFSVSIKNNVIDGETIKGNHTFSEPMYVKVLDELALVTGFDYSYVIRVESFETVIDDGQKVAALLYRLIDNDNEKHMIFAENIDKWTFDDNGEVMSKNDSRERI
ncbi:restriction endonuclease [Paenibacillus sp. LPE1-1-1.1]|uniref:restriction endonuclease n=1 Tax=Paenibacillus sp. LPE1-1-1.1 TaxID=3135230 RepID=UPI00342C8106